VRLGTLGAGEERRPAARTVGSSPTLESTRAPFLAAAALLAACSAAPPEPLATPPAPSAQPAPGTARAPARAYPPTRTADARDTFFGVPVADPYRWLEDAQSAEVTSWVAAEDALARAELDRLPGRDALRARLASLLYLEFVTPPLERGGLSFFSRQEAGQEKRKILVRKGEKGAERVLLDAAALSADGSTALGATSITLDGKKLAYVVHPNNADAGTVRVRDVATGADSAVDVIEGAKYAIPSWTPKGDGFYYVGVSTDPKTPAAELPGTSEVRFHALGTRPASDPVVLPRNGNAETELEARASRDGHFLVVHVIHGGDIRAVKLLDLRQKGAAWIDLVTGYEGAMDAFAHRDRIYLRTTEGAPRGKVMVIDPARPGREHWKEIVPESKDRVLTGASIVGGHLALAYLHKATSELELRALDGSGARAVTLPGLGTVDGISGEPDQDKAYYFFTSFTDPGSIYQLSVKTGESKLWYRIKAPVDPALYATEQVTYPSKDGTAVSMFVVRRRGAPRDGRTPFLLTGYGGFSVGVTPGFDPGDFVWLAAGGGLAVPNLRGGNEYGEDWHRAGMRERKQNVFDDFIGAAEHLVKSGDTKPELLVSEGASNGGLLVAATAVQRPDLFRAVLCGVPVIDMMRYPLWGDGKTWISEYGSPAEEATFKALLAYSPYHNVKAGTAYPAVLMLSADADDRVAPLHAWKMTAAWQAAQASDRPILMRVEKHSGHGGADQRKAQVERGADVLAFAMSAVGLAPPGPPGPPGG
jgi:prolyl oligopeptidase